jgi:tetratricopeptide (TPR) repeat protein
MDQLLYDSIKQYKNRQMPEAERLAFESRIKSDPDFAAEVSAWAAIYAGIQEKGDADLNAELTMLGRQLLQEQSGAPEMTASVNRDAVARRFAIPRWVYAAAALFLLLMVAWPVYQRLNNPENTYASAETLYNEHFRQPGATTVRGGGTAPWRAAYEQKRYAEAITELTKEIANTPGQPHSEAYLYLGLAQLGAGQAKEAIEAFRQVGSDSTYADDAQWYQALAYLKLGDIDNAKKLLQAIAAQTGHEKRGEAGMMWKRLK